MIVIYKIILLLIKFDHVDDVFNFTSKHFNSLIYVIFLFSTIFLHNMKTFGILTINKDAFVSVKKVNGKQKRIF